MPNWVENYGTIWVREEKGRAVFERLTEPLRDGNYKGWLERIIPMPEELQIHDKQFKEDENPESWLRARTQFKGHLGTFKPSDYDRAYCDFTRSPEYEAYIKETYGYTEAGNDWRIKFLGAKWGAREDINLKLVDEKTIRFDFMSAWAPTTPFFHVLSQNGLDFKVNFSDCDDPNYGGFINCIDGEIKEGHYEGADWTIFCIERDPYEIDSILQRNHQYGVDGETFEEWKENIYSLPEDPRILKLIEDNYTKYELLKSVENELSLEVAQKIGTYKTGYFDFPIRSIQAQSLKEILNAVRSFGFLQLEELDEDCIRLLTQKTTGGVQLKNLKDLASFQPFFKDFRIPLTLGSKPVIDVELAKAIAQYKGPNLTLPKAEEITPQAAQYLLDAKVGFTIDASNIVSINAPTAHLLCQKKEALFFHKLSTIDVESAKVLAQSNLNSLYMHQLKEATDESRTELYKFKGEISTGFPSLPTEILEQIVEQANKNTIKKDLQLSISELSVQGAQALASYTGENIYIRNVRSLSPQVAKALYAFQGKVHLGFYAHRCKALDADLAALLIKGDRRINFAELESLDAATAQVIAQSTAKHLMLKKAHFGLEEARILSTFKGQGAQLGSHSAEVIAEFKNCEFYLSFCNTQFTPELRSVLSGFSKMPYFALLQSISTEDVLLLRKADRINISHVAEIPLECAKLLADFEGLIWTCNASEEVLAALGKPDRIRKSSKPTDS